MNEQYDRAVSYVQRCSFLEKELERVKLWYGLAIWVLIGIDVCWIINELR